jgi:hypothetical protein
VTTQLHVAAPFASPVRVDLFVAPRAGVTTEQVAGDVDAALAEFFDPDAWPFGRGVYVSEIYALLEGLTSVDYVPFVGLSSPASPDPQTVTASELWHDDGDQIGLALGEYTLPRMLEEHDVYVSSAFVAVTVVVTVRASAGAAPAEVRRAVKLAVREFFRPEQQWPKSVEALKVAIAAAPGVAAVADDEDEPFPEPTTTPDRIGRDPLGNAELRLRSGELADVTTFVTVV